MICAIVLAAGKSERMGTQKLILPWKGSTVIGHITDELLASTLKQIIVVTGHNRDGVEEVLSGRRVTFIHNTLYNRGMLSSVRCGLKALPKSCSAVLVALGDQPGISCTLVDRMVEAYASTNKRLLVPSYQGRRGHPLLFSTEFCPEIHTDFDDTGLRGLLHRYPDEVYEWPCADSDIMLDIDTPEDYRNYGQNEI
jgi:molybdenum cofactor cytidylyltransferase